MVLDDPDDAAHRLNRRHRLERREPDRGRRRPLPDLLLDRVLRRHARRPRGRREQHRLRARGPHAGRPSSSPASRPAHRARQVPRRVHVHRDVHRDARAGRRAAFLFGGVTATEVVVAFAFLFLFALLTVAFGLAISSKMSSLRAAIVVTLLVSVPLSLFCFGVLGLGLSGGIHEILAPGAQGAPGVAADGLRSRHAEPHLRSDSDRLAARVVRSASVVSLRGHGGEPEESERRPFHSSEALVRVFASCHRRDGRRGRGDRERLGRACRRHHRGRGHRVLFGLQRARLCR